MCNILVHRCKDRLLPDRVLVGRSCSTYPYLADWSEEETSGTLSDFDSPSTPILRSPRSSRRTDQGPGNWRQMTRLTYLVPVGEALVCKVRRGMRLWHTFAVFCGLV